MVNAPPDERNQRFALGDACALGALAIVAWMAAGFLLRDDVFIYGDHPVHYGVMWYTLNVSAPLHQRLVDWVPLWNAGYPHLQFYPPGFVFLGWLLNLLTLGEFSTALIYESIAFIAYALPGFSFYYALRHLKFERGAAFLAGLFGLVFPAFFDGAIGLFIGMIGSRLAFGLNAFVLVWGIDVVGGRGRHYAWLSVAMLAIAILVHPYHILGLGFALAVYALCVARRLALWRSVLQLGGVFALALAIDAFWLLPLIVHTFSEMVPLIRSTFDQTWRLLTDAMLVPYVLFTLPIAIKIRREQISTRRAVSIVLIVLLIAVGSAMLSAHTILLERLHFYQLDPVRLVGEFYLPLLWLAAIGASEIATWFANQVYQVIGRRQAQTNIAKHTCTCGYRKCRCPVGTEKFRKVSAFFCARPRPIILFRTSFVLLVGGLVAIPFLQSVAFFQPQANDEPRFFSQAIADYRLDELGVVLREVEGRVYVTSSYTQLTARARQPLPTTMLALIPFFADRQMMGGTYSFWSPIAALTWVGKLDPPVLEGLAETLDDRALFGIPLENLTDGQLTAYCTRFNITTIIASVNDYNTRVWLDKSQHFQSYYNNGFFFVYRVKDYSSAWIMPQNASVELVSRADRQIELNVLAAQADASVVVKVYAYPLWRAYTDTGQSLPIVRDEFGLMRLALPRGKNYAVRIRYEEGTAEQIGNLISVSSVAGLVGMALLTLGRRFSRKRLFKE